MSPSWTSRRRLTRLGWRPLWFSCMKQEWQGSCGLSSPISSVTRVPRFDWARSCQRLGKTKGWLRAEFLSPLLSDFLIDCLARTVHESAPGVHKLPLPRVTWGSEFLSRAPSALRILDQGLRRWERHLLGSPCAGVLLELGWPDADRVSTGRLLTLWGRTSSMAVHPRCPISVKVLQIASGVPGTWAHHSQTLCSFFGAPLSSHSWVVRRVSFWHGSSVV